MNTTEAKMLWLYMRETWPNYALPSGPEIGLREQVWMDLLGDQEAQFIRGVIALLAGREFAPTPGQIREEADAALMRMKGETPPDPDEAWREVREAVLRGGVDGQPEWSHPAIANAVRAMGWRDYCMSETEAAGTWRAHFLRFYATATERVKRDAGIGAPPIIAELGRKFAGELTA